MGGLAAYVGQNTAMWPPHVVWDGHMWLDSKGRMKAGEKMESEGGSRESQVAA